MTIKLTHDIFCDECGDWAHCHLVSPWAQITRARKAAQAEGWKRVKRGYRMIDLCPKCAAKRATKRAEADE